MRFAYLLSFFLVSCNGDSVIIPTSQAQSVFGERVSFELTQAKENNPQGLWRGVSDPNDCNWAGSAATGNVSVWFHYRHKRIVYAWWIATVVPNGGGVRLLMYDSRYQLQVLADVRSDETNPRPLGAWIETALNEAIATADPAYPFKYIGIQVCGQARLFTSAIYLVTE